MIKKVLIIYLFIVFISHSFFIPAFSTTNDSSSLNSIELKLFNHSYTKETPAERLDRIENSIFGRTYNQSVDSRITRINNLFSSLSKKQVAIENSKIIEAQSATDYPAVTQLELRVFQHAYIKEDVAERLSRLETKVFGSAFPNDNLSDRLDHLQSTVTGENKTPYEDNSDEITIPESQNSSGNSYLQGNLSALEKNILGQTYENDVIDQRLDRLEIKAFGATQPGTADARLNKLNSIVENSVPAPVNHQNDYIANSMQNGAMNQSGWDNSFFDDQSQTNQKSGFLSFLQNLALPILSTFMNKNNSYVANPYGYPQTYVNPGFYNPRYNHPYQYSTPYVPSYWNSANNYNYGQGSDVQTQELLQNNFGMGVHILPY